MTEPNEGPQPVSLGSPPTCIPRREHKTRLSPGEAQAYVAKLNHWRLNESAERISKTWRMKDFAAAMEFLRQVGELAEALDHHPDLHLERYRYVRIELWTHSVGGLTPIDFQLASQIDELATRLGLA